MSELLPSTGNIRLALVTGGHSFQVPPLYQVFRHLPDVDFYPQAIDEFRSEPEIAAAYNVVLFYTMHRFQPGDELPWYQEKLFSTLEQPGRANQGIGILHHSLVAFPQLSFWSELVGITERETIEAHWGETVATQVQDAQHPITQGITRWTMRDETYQMAEPEDDGNNHILLTTNHPKSMKAMAWTRNFRGSRVFCYQAGHDAAAFGNSNFQRVQHNALRWLAQR